MRSTLALCALLAFAGASGAQTCQLTLSGTVAPGSTFSLDLTDSLPDAATFLGIGFNEGTTVLGGGAFSITVGLAPGFAILPAGKTDANGDLSWGATLPAGIQLPWSTLYAQMVSIDAALPGPPAGPGGPPASIGVPAIVVCASNVLPIPLGP